MDRPDNTPERGVLQAARRPLTERLGAPALPAQSAAPRRTHLDADAHKHRRENARELASERFSDSTAWFWVSTTIGSVAVACFLAVAIPTFGWVPFLVLGVPAIAGSVATLIGKEVGGARTYAVSHLLWLVGVGVSACFAGGADSFLLAWLAPMALGFYSRLHPREANRYAWAALALASAPVLVTDWDGFLRSPWMLTGVATSMVGLTLLAGQMAAGEIHQRAEATIDQLTGLLNRRGLGERITELKQQAVVLGDDTPIAVLACDLDHFKLINDTYGHARGDDVLRDVAYVIRKQLRRFELAYRMGGEEFLILLPGHDSAAGAEVAESIRSAIEAASPGGLAVTISIGVASCRAALAEDVELLVDADHALYAAKAAGRNRIVQAAHDDVVPTENHRPTHSGSPPI